MLYQNLPGINLTVKDGNLVLPAEDFGTERVLIIAPTSETPSATEMGSDPKLVKSSEEFQNNFGLFNKSNPLARLWKQAFDAGCRSIYLLELTGGTAEEMYANLHKGYSVIEDGFEVDIILVGGVYADSAITGTVDLTGTPREDYIASGSVGSFTEVEAPDSTTGTLDGNETDILITNPYVSSTLVVTVTPDLGDPTVLSEDEYTLDFENSKVILETPLAEGDLAEVSYQTYEYSFAKQLAGFCSEASSKYSQTIGIISMDLLSGLDASSLSSIKEIVDGQGKQQYNQYLQVVGGAPLYFEINNEVYMDSFAGAYAGMISVLASYSSPTNKVIPGALHPVFNLSPAQLQKLTNENQIVVPRSRNGRLVIADAVTTAYETSDFIRLSTLRITNDVVGLIRELGEPYIGEPNTLARRNALETAIRGSLNNMIKRGALNDFRFNIKASVADQIQGNMLIFVDIVPAFETRRISVTVALKPSLS